MHVSFARGLPLILHVLVVQPLEGETTFTCNGPWGDYPRDLGIRPI